MIHLPAIIRSSAPPRVLEDIVLSVIAPCYQEAGNIDLLCDRTLTVFDQLGAEAELLLIDDGSRDATWDEVTARSEADPRVRGLRHDVNQGIEAAWRIGLAHARGHLICLIDADLQNRPEDIERLYRTYLRTLPDIVQGVRRPARGVTRCKLFSRGLNCLLNVTFGMKLRDSKSGFILCRRDVLQRMLRHRCHYRYFQSFVGVAAGAAGYAIAEVETTFDPRHAGKSFLSRFPILVSSCILWEMFKFRYETRRSAVPTIVAEKSMPSSTVPMASPSGS